MIHNFNTFVNNLNEAATSAQQEMEINAAVDTAIEAELNDKKPAATNPTSSLKFDGDYLHWLNDGVSVEKWKAYSGLSFANTPFNKEDYKKLMAIKLGDPNKTSELKSAGPTPPGVYNVGKLQAREGVKVNSPETYKSDDLGIIKALWIYNTSSPDKLANLTSWGMDSDLSKIGWGDFRATMNPATGTDAKHRGDMYIHGGSFAGSHGCIDLTDEMPDFAKWYAAWSVKNSGKTLTLLVDYDSINNSPLGTMPVSTLTDLVTPEDFKKSK